MKDENANLKFLFSKSTQDLLTELLNDQAAGKTLLQMTKKLRARISIDQVSQVLLQHELRQRAKTKFSRANEMFFTRKQLEQSTNEAISFYKSKRFSKSNRVADLCCGIGGDSIGLASASELSVVDLDSQIVAFAEKNIEAYGLNCEPMAADVMSVDVSKFDSFHIDPDRRVAGNRSTRSELFCPDKTALQSLINSNPNFAIKLAPATKPWLENCEHEYIGFDRECKQQIAWSGSLKNQSGVRVTTVGADGAILDSFFTETKPNDVSSHSNSSVAIGEQKQFIFDPHPCLVAAKLVNSFANQNGLNRLSHDTVYLTGGEPIQNTLVQCFKVIESCTLDESVIKKLLSKFDVGQLEVKKRGVELELMHRISKIKCSGPEAATLIMAPTIQGLRGFLCKRI